MAITVRVTPAVAGRPLPGPDNPAQGKPRDPRKCRHPTIPSLGHLPSSSLGFFPTLHRDGSTTPPLRFLAQLPCHRRPGERCEEAGVGRERKTGLRVVETPRVLRGKDPGVVGVKRAAENRVAEADAGPRALPQSTSCQHPSAAFTTFPRPKPLAPPTPLSAESVSPALTVTIPPAVFSKTWDLPLPPLSPRPALPNPDPPLSAPSPLSTRSSLKTQPLPRRKAFPCFSRSIGAFPHRKKRPQTHARPSTQGAPHDLPRRYPKTKPYAPATPSGVPLLRAPTRPKGISLPPATPQGVPLLPP
jgi:hypothetical protein